MGARPSSFVQEEKPVVAARVWSQQQLDIFQWFTHPFEGHPDDTPPEGKGDLVVSALAGTGKTSTIIEGVNRAPESSILVCAFNKRIADELNSRISNGAAEAKTLHSVGYAAIRRQWRGMPVSKGTERADSLTDAVCEKATPKPIRRLISMLHTKAREMNPMGATLQVITDLALFFDYVPDEGWSQYGLEYVVQMAWTALAQAAHADPTYDIGIDFADMIYLPLVWNLLSKDYDMVVVDEAQDLTVAQLTIAQRICSGRICVVGDPNQAIYGFRGADSKSLSRLKAELGAYELPLTTTYRCSQAVTRQAQILVPGLVAVTSNPEGTVDACDYETLLRGANAGDFILSRLNAPLVSITLQLLKQQKRARMSGRDIGAGIQAVLKKIRCFGSEDITVVLTRLDAWEAKTSTRLASYGQTALVDRCRDQAEMIRALAEDATDTADLVNRIDWLFTDDTEDTGIIVCSSIHKAKGLEAPRVYVLQESLYRRGDSQEERNCHYVAITRAINHLTLVTGVPNLGGH